MLTNATSRGVLAGFATPEGQGVALEARHLSRAIAGKVLVDDISVQVRQGEVLAVVGPSGAGKSSFLRLLNRLDEPTGGTVLLEGQDYRKIAPQTLRRRVGMVMQMAYLFPETVADNDFAVEEQRQGLPAAEAIFQGCLLRFRPIMMTTMAALMGTLPIALATGQGAESRRPLGLAVVGGLLVSQFLTLYLTPVIYLYMEEAREWLTRYRRKPAKIVSTEEPVGRPAA